MNILGRLGMPGLNQTSQYSNRMVRMDAAAVSTGTRKLGSDFFSLEDSAISKIANNRYETNTTLAKNLKGVVHDLDITVKTLDSLMSGWESMREHARSVRDNFESMTTAQVSSANAAFTLSASTMLSLAEEQFPSGNTILPSATPAIHLSEDTSLTVAVTNSLTYANRVDAPALSLMSQTGANDAVLALNGHIEDVLEDLHTYTALHETVRAYETNASNRAAALASLEKNTSELDVASAGAAVALHQMQYQQANLMLAKLVELSQMGSSMIANL